MSDEDFAILNPHVNPTAEPSTIPVEHIPELLNEMEYRKQVQTLNYEQRCVYQGLLE